MIKSAPIQPILTGKETSSRKRQIAHLCNEVERKQLTLIPLSMYFQKEWVKIELGLCRGRKYDKRQELLRKNRSAESPRL